MSTVPRNTEENQSSCAAAYASLSEPTGIVTRRAVFLSEAANVGSEIHAVEIFRGCHHLSYFTVVLGNRLRWLPRYQAKHYDVLHRLYKVLL